MSSTTIRINSLPYREDFRVYRGDTFEKIVFIIAKGNAQSFTPENLAGWVFTCKVKDNDGNVVYSLTEGSGITVTDADGLVQVLLSATQTAAFNSGCCYNYDVQGVRTSDLFTKTYRNGKLEVEKDIT